MLTPRLVCGSRMIDSSHKSPFSRFSKPIAGIVGAVGCAFLVGAAQPRPVDAPAKQTETKSVDLAPQAELSTELLHETTSTVAPAAAKCRDVASPIP